ncbi:Pyridoxamine 5'-phosphate oxidase [Friedmanniella luteola]|uniref:Pyridoxamine 5'-phosphate oxidase n=1 Tax=Friedmanniella luteola TaxID=546871 RepID=A0A1H1Y5M5_9ACTN|nr:pyridoxamine 5'-phosphate oxidase family protein [Friedmanniella luteola]SDT16692.1 Pyridoxamine 5'-phosphate oxidase [Friedmanniella luteola]
MTPSGDLSLLRDPVAQELLASKVPARLAYTWTDGSPRVVPIWFHWDGTAVVMGTPGRAPKLKALRRRPQAALTIDTEGFPAHVLSLRGEVEVQAVDGPPAEYVAAACRYLGEEQGRAWAAQLEGKPMARLRFVPRWATVLDFETRFPSALSA